MLQRHRNGRVWLGGDYNQQFFDANGTDTKVVDIHNIWRALEWNSTQLHVSLRLQARMPSVNVWSNFEAPTLPHLLNQAPPATQQLRSPLMVPHLGHAGMAAVVVAPVIVMRITVATVVRYDVRWRF